MGTPSSASSNSPLTSLGGVELPTGTVEHDFAVQARYEGFTAELARLALLGLTAIGYLAWEQHRGDDTSPDFTFGMHVCLFGSLLGFLVSAITALAHRYHSVESMTHHLLVLRCESRKAPGDDAKAGASRYRRDTHFKRSTRLVAVSALGLGGGAIALAALFALLVFH